MSVTSIESIEQFERIINYKNNEEKAIVIANFWATWSEPSVQLSQLFAQLASQRSNATFIQIQADLFEELSERFNISAVPTYLFFKVGRVEDRLEGANPTALSNKINLHVPFQGEDLNTRLTKLVNIAPVVLFMKGSPERPQCGFSSKMIDLLNKNKIKFGHFNILGDQEVREGLKKFSNWPTYPQLYFAGSLIGGLDVAKELSEQNELRQLAPSEALF
eukprot:TRINITY_DN136_c0_g1_i1.p1 TRINITY_DN136_c0_g1~~TRINITY_DN136_c0_g1_i1.p1  ORF type:complete len:219 (+),score=98.92 TRINITY_DN136_c0_g1_i1:33-689(+)